MLKISRIVVLFSLNVLLITVGLAHEDHEHPSASPPAHESPITAWVEGKSKDTGEREEIFFSNNSDSEIVLRDLKDVSVHCEAEYPVQLDFNSHGGFKLLATGSGSSSKSFSNGTHQLTVQKHTTYAHLVSLKEVYTGFYLCRGRTSPTKDNTISAFIYVPTEQLFISKRTATISSNGQNPLVIPCPISDPNATVTLSKHHGEDAIKPVLAATYDPKVGFSIENGNETESEDMDGTYYCIAKTKNVHRAVEFTVIKGPVVCTQRCGENSKCQLVNDQQVCECKPTYTETLVSEKCLLECRTDADCPSHMACMPQESGSFLLDILSSSEGRALADEGSTDEHHHVRMGECKNPCIYRTTTCSLGEIRHHNEECRVVEHKAHCSVPNENHEE